MPAVGKSSSKAGIHPYLKKDFEWPVYYIEDEKILCSIDDDAFIEERIDECRKNRTFHFNDYFARLLGMNNLPYCKVSKNVVYEMAKLKWDRNFEQLKRWSLLKEEEVILKNIGNGYWLAETIWVKAK